MGNKGPICPSPDNHQIDSSIRARQNLRISLFAAAFVDPLIRKISIASLCTLSTLVLPAPYPKFPLDVGRKNTSGVKGFRFFLNWNYKPKAHGESLLLLSTNFPWTNSPQRKCLANFKYLRWTPYTRPKGKKGVNSCGGPTFRIRAFFKMDITATCKRIETIVVGCTESLAFNFHLGRRKLSVSGYNTPRNVVVFMGGETVSQKKAGSCKGWPKLITRTGSASCLPLRNKCLDSASRL